MTERKGSVLWRQITIAQIPYVGQMNMNLNSQNSALRRRHAHIQTIYVSLIKAKAHAPLIIYVVSHSGECVSPRNDNI
jgi:hypothetical protein